LTTTVSISVLDIFINGVFLIGDFLTPQQILLYFFEYLNSLLLFF